jgi:hypothetical protein
MLKLCALSKWRPDAQPREPIQISSDVPAARHRAQQPRQVRDGPNVLGGLGQQLSQRLLRGVHAAVGAPAAELDVARDRHRARGHRLEVALVLARATPPELLDLQLDVTEARLEVFWRPAPQRGPVLDHPGQDHRLFGRDEARVKLARTDGADSLDFGHDGERPALRKWGRRWRALSATRRRRWQALNENDYQ